MRRREKGKKKRKQHAWYVDRIAYQGGSVYYYQSGKKLYSVTQRGEVESNYLREYSSWFRKEKHHGDTIIIIAID